ncbi:MAG: nucleotidyltransferase family protein [Acidobacteria bacterium]|nr:nucleotidyltransferase family protein [Acidobacteriota bacterium]
MKLETSDNDSRWNVLQVKLQEHQACRVFAAFQEIGIEPILIKGFAAARYYPENIGRASVDIDLCFDPKDLEKAKDFISSNPISGVSIDFHEGFRHLDSLSWELLLGRSEVLNIEGQDIRVLCREDHLRVLAVHWLTDGGENKNRLWDIYYAVSTRDKDFDWDKCLGVVNENRRKWVIYTIGLAHLFLGLDISGLPIEADAKNVPLWMKKEIEKQWELDIPIIPLNTVLSDREKFRQQLRKRIPPNPIYSTISMEGSLDARTRVFYQIGNFLMRLAPTWRQIIAGYFRRKR